MRSACRLEKLGPPCGLCVRIFSFHLRTWRSMRAAAKSTDEYMSSVVSRACKTMPLGRVKENSAVWLWLRSTEKVAWAARSSRWKYLRILSRRSSAYSLTAGEASMWRNVVEICIQCASIQGGSGLAGKAKSKRPAGACCWKESSTARGTWRPCDERSRCSGRQEVPRSAGPSAGASHPRFQ